MAKASFSQELSMLKEEIEKLKASNAAIELPSGIRNKFIEEDQRELSNEKNIEKLKELVMLLNREIVSYRRQVGSLIKIPDVPKVISDIYQRFNDLQKTIDSVGAGQRIEEISQKTMQQFEEMKQYNSRIMALQQQLEQLSQEMWATQEKTTNLITNKELTHAIESYNDQVSMQLRRVNDEVKKRIQGGMREFEVSHLPPSFMKEPGPSRKEITEHLMEHDRKISKELEGLRRYAHGALAQSPALKPVNQQLQQIERKHAEQLRDLHSRIGSEHDAVVQQHIQKASAEINAHLQGAREKVIDATVDAAKLQKLQVALQKRQFKPVAEAEPSRSAVDITIGKVRENAVTQGIQKAAPLQQIVVKITPKPLPEESSILVDVRPKEKIVAAAVSERDLIRGEFLKLKESVEEVQQKANPVAKLESMLHLIQETLAQGEKQRAIPLYHQAMDIYVALNKKNHNVAVAYQALMKAYQQLRYSQ